MSKFITGEQFNAGVKQVATALNTKMESLPGKTIVKEISNPLTTSPLEYGYFRPSADINSYVANSTIAFDSLLSGNMKVNDDKTFTLKAGKSYMINASMYCTSVSSAYASGLRLVDASDETNSILIGGATVPVTHTKSYIPSNLSGIITLEKDINVRIINTQDLTVISSAYSNLTIMEIRNNPVNQYGGFETEVLFEGNANEFIEYELADNVDNYDLLIVEINKNASIGDINYSLPPATSNTTPAPLNITYSSLYNASYSGWGAFNQKQAGTYDCWCGTGSSGWLKIDTGKITKSIGCYLGARTYNNVGLKDWVIEGSNDDSIWEIIISDSAPLPKNRAYYSFNKEVGYRYYRITGSAYGADPLVGSFDLVSKPLDVLKIEIISTSNKSLLLDDGTIKLNFIENKMNILSIGLDGITKIIGIKGQLPSLLCGGEF